MLIRGKKRLKNMPAVGWVGLTRKQKKKKKMAGSGRAKIGGFESS